MSELAKRFYNKTGVDFTDFYNNYKNYYKYIVYNIIKDQDLSEDIVNDAFINILNNINTYDSNISLLTTWCYTIVKNTAVKFKKVISRLNLTYTNELWNNDVINEEYDEEIDIISDRLIRIIYNNMDKKQKLRDALIMRDIHKMSYEDMSNSLQLNINTVKSRVKKGRMEVEKIYNIIYKKNE